MGPVAGGAARLLACAADEDARPVADDKTEGPAARGGDGALRALAHYRLWLQTSSPGVLPLPEPPDGLWSLPDPPPHGLWPTLVPAWKRSMCHSSLSVRVHHRRFSLALIVALRLIVSSSILPRHLMGLSGIPSVKKLSQSRR